MRALGLLVASVVLAVGCESADVDSCKVVCSADTDCPTGQLCGDLGLCSSGEVCPCEAGAFLSCDGEVARFCNATADGLTFETCSAGCNADAGRCNQCVPDQLTCSTDNTMLEQCGSDGLMASATACDLGCMPADDTRAAHCGHIEPLFFPTLCDEPATESSRTFADVTLDTKADANCNGGILTQTGGPEVCVVRYGTITIGNDVIVRGSRAIAFVADDAVLVQGVLDVSADSSTNGPGGGAVSGQRATVNRGGGGAGFGAQGGAGGTGNGGSGAGGAPVDPLDTMVFRGGAHSEGPPPLTMGHPFPGGAGGALMLVACRGEVAISGTIDAGGGGGPGARDVGIVEVQIVGGTGGGSGGYVVLQGVDVRVTGAVFANGGGGGAACQTDNCTGEAGKDALRSTAPAPKAGGGGQGGALGFAATNGATSGLGPPGGGGSVGRLQVCHLPTGTVTLGGTASPAFLPHVTITTR